MSTDQEIRERLKTSLDQLIKLKSTQLIREDVVGPQLSFRVGIPFFERTLALYRQLANTDLSRVPSAYLEIAVNHAEESLNQFQQIEAFDPHGMDRPDQIRNLLVNDVRDAYAPIYEDLSVILAPSKGQGESVPRPTSPLFGFLVVALIAGSLIVSYHYSALDSLIDSIQSFARSMLKGG